MGRLKTVGEALLAALHSLAVVAPQWLQQQVTSEWFDRYSLRMETSRFPVSETARTAYALQSGRDGIHVLTALYADTAPAHLREIEAVEIVRRTWIAHFYYEDATLHWRTGREGPPSHFRVHSPYDLDADYTTKRSAIWTGYKVHLTETCDPDQIHLITHVDTTRATVNDVERTVPIEEALVAAKIAPAEHSVDCGYVTAELLLTGEAERGVKRIGPLRTDSSWQTLTDSPFSNTHFTIAWAEESGVSEGQTQYSMATQSGSRGGQT